MDLLDFDGQQELYFNEALPEGVSELLAQASSGYSEGTAEAPLLKAAELAPESLSVLVALYRFYYYQHRLADTFAIAERAIEVSGSTLDFPVDWRELSPEHLAAGAEKSMGLVRFYLLSLKGAGWLKMRLNASAEAREILEKLAALDTANRLGIRDLLKLLDDMEAGDEEALA
jgi:tetratricopeptide (TPR) repeat protein